MARSKQTRTARAWTTSAVALVLGAGVAGAALAAVPTIDGRMDGIAEGYTGGIEIDLGDGTGELWFFQDATSASFALVLPLNLKDNTYGANVSAGYSQQFQSLTGSDKLKLDFNNTSGALITNDFTLDFLEGDPNDDFGSTFDSGFTGAESSASTPPAGFAAATSMDYNCNSVAGGGAFCGKDLNSPVSLAGWVFEHIYEFKVPLSVFGGTLTDVATQVVLAEIHLSPKKSGSFDTSEPPFGDEFCTADNPGAPVSGSGACDSGGGGTPGVPEPSSLSLLAFGMMGFLGAGIRRRRDAS